MPSIDEPSPLPGSSVGGGAGAKTIDATIAHDDADGDDRADRPPDELAAAALGELLLVLGELLLALLLALLLDGLGDLRLRGRIAAGFFSSGAGVSGSCVVISARAPVRTRGCVRKAHPSYSSAWDRGLGSARQSDQGTRGRREHGTASGIMECRIDSGTVRPSPSRLNRTTGVDAPPAADRLPPKRRDCARYRHRSHSEASIPRAVRTLVRIHAAAARADHGCDPHARQQPGDGAHHAAPGRRDPAPPPGALHRPARRADRSRAVHDRPLPARLPGARERLPDHRGRRSSSL